MRYKVFYLETNKFICSFDHDGLIQDKEVINLPDGESYVVQKLEHNIGTYLGPKHISTVSQNMCKLLVSKVLKNG